MCLCVLSIRELLSSDAMREYSRARVYLDENYKSQEHFTVSAVWYISGEFTFYGKVHTNSLEFEAIYSKLTCVELGMNHTLNNSIRFFSLVQFGLRLILSISKTGFSSPIHIIRITWKKTYSPMRWKTDRRIMYLTLISNKTQKVCFSISLNRAPFLWTLTSLTRKHLRLWHASSHKSFCDHSS